MRVVAALVALGFLAWSGAGTAQEQWAEFSSPQYGFAGLFPKTPTEQGSPNANQRSFLTDLGNIAYIVSVVDLPPANAPANPDAAYFGRLVEAYASGSGSKVRTQRPATLVGHSGVEAITDDTEHNLYWLVNLTLVGNRLYMVISGGPKGHEASPDAYRFRDSFRLLSP